MARSKKTAAGAENAEESATWTNDSEDFILHRIWDSRNILFGENPLSSIKGTALTAQEWKNIHRSSMAQGFSYTLDQIKTKYFNTRYTGVKKGRQLQKALEQTGNEPIPELKITNAEAVFIQLWFQSAEIKGIGARLDSSRQRQNQNSGQKASLTPYQQVKLQERAQVVPHPFQVPNTPARNAPLEIMDITPDLGHACEGPAAPGAEAVPFNTQMPECSQLTQLDSDGTCSQTKNIEVTYADAYDEYQNLLNEQNQEMDSANASSGLLSTTEALAPGVPSTTRLHTGNSAQPVFQEQMSSSLGQASSTSSSQSASTKFMKSLEANIVGRARSRNIFTTAQSTVQATGVQQMSPAAAQQTSSAAVRQVSSAPDQQTSTSSAQQASQGGSARKRKRGSVQNAMVPLTVSDDDDPFVVDGPARTRNINNLYKQALYWQIKEHQQKIRNLQLEETLLSLKIKKLRKTDPKGSSTNIPESDEE